LSRGGGESGFKEKKKKRCFFGDGNKKGVCSALLEDGEIARSTRLLYVRKKNIPQASEGGAVEGARSALWKRKKRSTDSFAGKGKRRGGEEGDHFKRSLKKNARGEEV